MRYGTWTGALALAAMALTGCGGGGGDSDAGSAGISEGFWSAEDFGLLVTGTGEMWAIETDASPYVLYRGSVSTSGTQASGTFTGYQGASSFSGTPNGTAAGVLARTSSSQLVGGVVFNGRGDAFVLTRYALN
jgi:hypothetical protein